MTKVHESKKQKGQWWFQCLGCKSIHAVYTEGETKWTFNGDVINPTFTPSILTSWELESGKRICHLFITNGKIQYCEDSWHELAGQTVDMVELDPERMENY